MRIIISFRDSNAKTDFENAIEESFKDGEIKHVEGVQTIEDVYIDGNSKYPAGKKDVKDSEMFIGLVPNDKTITVSNRYGARTLNLKYFVLQNGAVRWFSDDSTVRYSITFKKSPTTAEFSYKIDIKNAKTLKSIVDSFLDAYAVFNELGKTTNDRSKLDAVLSQFSNAIGFYSRLNQLNKLLNLQLNPSELEGDSESVPIADELYFLLCEKNVIRRNTKLENVTRECSIEEKELPSPGTKLVAWFNQPVSYKFFSRSVDLHKVIVVFNLIVDHAEYDKDHNMVIHFTEESSKPMYNAFKAFLSPEEAKLEGEKALDKIKEYEVSKTLPELVEQQEAKITGS